MKNILRDKLGRFKSLKINLLDGQRRGEVVFRRIFLLVVLYIIIVLVGRAFSPKPQERSEVKEVEAIEYIYTKEDYPELYEPSEAVQTIASEGGKGVVEDGVSRFVKSYGGRIDDEYLGCLRENCTPEALKIVVAISVAETSMGKATGKQSNFFGWYKGGDRKYDPSTQEMAVEICRGIQKSYMNISNASVAGIYTGNDRTGNWLRNFNWAMSQM